MKFKYDIPLSAISKVSTSSQGDSLLVVHVKTEKDSKALAKGDLMLYIEP
jgi:hypothetical protein